MSPKTCDQNLTVRVEYDRAAGEGMTLYPSCSTPTLGSGQVRKTRPLVLGGEVAKKKCLKEYKET